MHVSVRTVKHNCLKIGLDNSRKETANIPLRMFVTLCMLFQ